ncbi:DUF4158 domain-containing protein [Streptomyces sp. NPDC006510]|uniref:DUF4158 domain-containing protein n=1 Tax=Streptomyces sp. NPDC006510 TaxID=3155600 RepID=UPI0033A1D832
MPAEVADYLADQLGIADASVLKAYGERENTRLDHVRELRRVLEVRLPSAALEKAWLPGSRDAKISPQLDPHPRPGGPHGRHLAAAVDHGPVVAASVHSRRRRRPVRLPEPAERGALLVPAGAHA